MREEMIYLVDGTGVRIGVAEKMRAHEMGSLHEAFSIFVFDPSGFILLQKRASGKYHSGGLWTNACCSHPREGEGPLEAAHRRLAEEMGFDCELTESHQFTYRVEFANGITEYEYDRVFVGAYDGPVSPNPEEAEGYKWADSALVLKDMEANPSLYTYWFRIALPEVMRRMRA